MMVRVVGDGRGLGARCGDGAVGLTDTGCGGSDGAIGWRRWLWVSGGYGSMGSGSPVGGYGGAVEMGGTATVAEVGWSCGGDSGVWWCGRGRGSDLGVRL
ncbi:hypothetical protein F0562_026606 [Nyssa sinensis]|uniref:Uncharacterized protein n=1 Tax=Nyssa sinensis TaxID=561372 RepID=A0A5J5BB90_9ASTE|nr:hypothetical protein F0562_026606 [Nyssa sinensis]